MAKKKTEDLPEESYWKPVFSAELVSRIMKIVGQTGLSPTDLVLKWVLQEESHIGLVLANSTQTTMRSKTATEQDKDAEDVSLDPGSPDYRKELVNRAKKLKKSGMTLKKIADTFNDEGVLTVSGTGKWYASSVANLLSSKK